MPRSVLALLCVASGLSVIAGAQNAPANPPAAQPVAPLQNPAGSPTAPPATSDAPATPPIAPNTVETPVPPRIVLPSPPVLPADVPERPLTADEAALIALRRQSTIAVARAGVVAAQGRSQQVRSGLLPSVSLSGSYNNVQSLSGGTASGVISNAGGTGSGSTGGTSTGTGGTGGTGTGSTGGTGTGTTSGGATVVTPLVTSGGTTVSGFLLSATLRQLLFDFGHTRGLVRQSTALERVAAQNLTRVQYDLVNQVKQAYYQTLGNEQLVLVNQDNLGNRQAQLALARARLNSGLGLPSDVVTAETSVSEAVINLNIAQNNASLTRVNLAYLMGIDPRTPLVLASIGEAPIASDDVNDLVTSALRQRPEVLQAEASLQANQYGVGAARSTNAPVVSGNLGVSSRGDQFLPGNDSFTVGVQVQFTPFDGGLTSGKVKEARANLTAAQAQLVDARQVVTSDVSQAFFNLKTAEQRVLTANIEVTNAREGVRIAEGRYRSGLGLFLDIINAQAQLLTARTNLVTAQAAIEQARAALNRAIGRPIPAPPR